MQRKLPRLSKHPAHIRWMLATFAFIASYAIASAQAYAINQNGLHTWGIHYYDIKVPCSADESADASLPGTEASGDSVKYLPQVPPGTKTEDQIWYFFTTEVGLSPEAAAGILGSIQGESHFDPKAEQTPGAWEDMSSLNINQGSKGGVGLVQWDGGRRPAYMNYAKAHNADKKNIVPQLNYIWYELNTSYKGVLAGLKAANSPEKAAEVWVRQYEIPGNIEDAVAKRSKWARTAYNTYFSKTITGSPSGTASAATDNCNGDVNTSIGTDCGNAQGNARILCAAKLYDTASYSFGSGHNGAANWHKDCDTTYHYLGNPPAKTLNGNAVGPKCYIDCSSLVDLAIYDVFKEDLNEDTSSERAHIGTNWARTSLEKLQPGDIIQPHVGHVEIVDHVQGDRIYTFGAHSSHYPQPRQVGPSSFPVKAGNLYLHYTGTGGQ